MMGFMGERKSVEIRGYVSRERRQIFIRSFTPPLVQINFQISAFYANLEVRPKVLFSTVQYTQFRLNAEQAMNTKQREY